MFWSTFMFSDEKLCNLKMTILTGIVKWSLTSRSASFRIALVTLNKVLSDGQTPMLTSNVQGSEA